jgi:hypothetical protein
MVWSFWGIVGANVLARERVVGVEKTKKEARKKGPGNDCIKVVCSSHMLAFVGWLRCCLQRGLGLFFSFPRALHVGAEEIGPDHERADRRGFMCVYAFLTCLSMA